MEIEQLEVLNFISRHPPFSDLPEVELRKIAKNIEVAYYKKDTDILKYGSPIHDLYMIRSGVVEVYRRNGELY
ncbi:cyclic nucleotide-binding domain-containing protein, partial [Aeromonas caviae]